MTMFSIDSRLQASNKAQKLLKLWEKSLSLRISLEKPLEISNKLPSNTHSNSSSSEAKQLLDVTNNLYKILLTQSPSMKEMPNDVESWDNLDQLNQSMSVQWREVLNKWYFRLQYGSADAGNKMKTFKQSFWDQITLALSNDVRIREKSCIPWEDSQRLDKEKDGDSNIDNRDVEVYDDRQFYSLLLKMFISQSSSSSNLMHNSDLEAIRKLKKNKSRVERKASKGRKIRYTVHNKLQNFMFPITTTIPSVDVDKLYQSIFHSS